MALNLTNQPCRDIKPKDLSCLPAHGSFSLRWAGRSAGPPTEVWKFFGRFHEGRRMCGFEQYKIISGRLRPLIGILER